MTTDTMTPALALNWEVVAKPPAEVNAELRAQVAELLAQGNVQAVRHQMAQAFTAMQIKGYNALLNYGINYQSLPSYKDTTLLDAAAEMPLLEGQERYFEYMRRVSHDIDAAIRRRGLTRIK